MLTQTENGALSLATTKDGRVDYFYKTIRGLSVTDHNLYLQSSWREDPLDTLKMIHFIRDTRGSGKGEKKLFHDAIKLLMKEHPLQVVANMKHMPFYGYYKDWLVCFAGDSVFEPLMLDALSEQLKNDWTLIDPNAIIAVEEEKEEKKEKKSQNISLAWKWTPTEKCSFDKKYKLVGKLCKRMKITRKEYREHCKIGRAVLNVVEQLMCSAKWEKIDFGKVSSVAMNRYKKAFSKHQAERWSEYLKNVQKGEAKMNVGQLMPNEIVKQYLNSHQVKDLDEGVEAQWIAYKKHLDEKIIWDGNVMTVLDVSGSMAGTPLEVGTALALTCAHVCKGKFGNRFIPFSHTAKFVEIKGNTLREQLQCITNVSEVANTDFQKVFDLILDSYKMWNVPEEQQIHRLFVITDGQWDSMADNSSKTHFEVIDKKFAKDGYKRPEIVFWNVRAGTVDFPAPQGQKGVALVSGYSSDLMKLFVDGEDLSPFGIMRKAIDDERYKRLVLVDEDEEEEEKDDAFTEIRKAIKKEKSKTQPQVSDALDIVLIEKEEKEDEWVKQSWKTQLHVSDDSDDSSI